MGYVYSQLVKAQFENLASDPASNPDGLVYLNTTSNVVKWYANSSWRTAVDTDTIQSLSGKTFTDDVSFTSTGAIKTPVGTTAQRPTPAQGQIRYNTTDSVFEGYDGSDWGSLGGGGGGGGGFIWNEVSGSSPTRSFLADERVYDFEQSVSQKLAGWVKVPTGYVAGKQIKMKCQFAVDSAGTDDVRMETISTRIASGEAVDSTTNQHTATNADNTLSGTAKALNSVEFDLTDGVGEVNGQAVLPGQLLKVELTRSAPAGTEDTNDIRLIPSVTEVTFS